MEASVTMHWTHKTLMVLAGGLFCLLLLRVSETASVTNAATSAASATINLAVVAQTDRAPFASRAAAPAADENGQFLADFERTLAKSGEHLGAFALQAPAPGRNELASPELSGVPRSSDTPAPPQRYRDIWAQVTAYCPCARCCGYSAHGRTSLGKSAWQPGLAADPRALPYGTRIGISGYGIATVDDTGGAMRRNWSDRGVTHIDVRMKWHADARRWGKRWMKVRVYEN
jgi:3D (Asp-Asp-Asp) domain-containing protein